MMSSNMVQESMKVKAKARCTDESCSWIEKDSARGNERDKKKKKKKKRGGGRRERRRRESE